MFIYMLCKQNYPSVMEEVHRNIDCGKRRNDQKSLFYSHRRRHSYMEPVVELERHRWLHLERLV